MSFGDYFPMIFSAMGGAVGSYIAVRVELAVLRTRIDHLEEQHSLFRGEMRQDIRSIRGRLP